MIRAASLLRPLESLIEFWPVKLILTFALGAAAALVEDLLAAFGLLFSVNRILIYMAATIFVIDLVSGVYATLRYENKGPFQITELKRTGFKFTEWGLIIIACLSVANGADEAGLPILNRLHIGAIFWLSITDLFSIAANLKGSEAAAVEWISNMMKVARGNLTASDLRQQEASDSP